MKQMQHPNRSPKPDVVKTIFERPSRRAISGLFTHRAAKPTSLDTKKQLPFGIDIGTDSVKVVQLARTANDSVKLSKLVIEELPKDVRESAEERARRLPDLLRRIVKENDLRGECFVAAPREAAKVNFVKLPKMPAGEIEKALRWEIGEGDKHDTDALFWDYILLENQKAGFLSDQTGVISVVAPKKEIVSFIGLLQSVGLAPLAVDVDILAGIAALDYAGQIKPDEVVLYLDFGSGKTTLSIISNKELISTRAIAVTGNTLTNTVSGYCNVPLEGAEALKRTFGISGFMKDQKPREIVNGAVPEEPANKAEQVKNAILPRLDNIVQDIEHTFKHFSYQMTQSYITYFNKLIISGGSSYTRDLVPFLENRLGSRVEIAKTLSGLSGESVHVHQEIMQSYGIRNIDDLSGLMNVAVGLALRAL